jgi:hypothetical protein
MSLPIAVLVRLAVLGVGLGVYYAAMPSLFPDDALGAGLIAFAALILISFVWSLFDGRASGFGADLVIWVVVAVVFSIGWWIALAVSGADDSMTVVELLKADAFSLFFTGGLVAVPALVGAAIGHALRPDDAR